MKKAVLLLVVLISVECLILRTYYPKKQQEILQLETNLQNRIEEIKNLDYQMAHIDVLEAQIAQKEAQLIQKEVRDQLLDLLEKIETYPFQEVHYKKLKDNKSKYLLSAVGHYNNVIDLLEYIHYQTNGIEIKSLYLDSSVQDMTNPINLSYVTIYGDKLKQVYAINLEWIVDDE